MNPVLFSEVDNKIKYSTEEYVRKFKFSYMKFRFPESKIEFVDLIRTIDNKSITLYQTGKFSLNEIEIVEEMPDAGLYNYNNYVLKLSRLPTRQYQRGLNNLTARITSLPDRTNLVETLDIAKTLFNPAYPSFYNASLELQSGVLARAINNKYWITKGKLKDIEVYRKNLRVGIWSGKKFWPEACCSLIRVELKDDLGV